MATEAFDAVILIAHGARDARWMEPFWRMRETLAARLVPKHVALAFMEFAEPSFAVAVADLARAGARRILVSPIFLSGGGHVAHDVPELVRIEGERHPALTFTTAGAIGEEAEVVAGMIEAVMRHARSAGT